MCDGRSIQTMSPASGGFRKRAPKARDPAPAYAPCPACGLMVLTGQTRTGERLALDVHVPTWCVLWNTGEALPVLEQSRGYPVHGCVAGVGTATPSRGRRGISCGEQLIPHERSRG